MSTEAPARQPHAIDPWIRRIKIALVLVAVLLLLLLGNPYGFGLIETAGRNIPQRDLVADFVAGLLWAVFLGCTLVFWPIRSQEKRELAWLWLAKCEMMLGFMLLYEWNYDLDAYGYWIQGRSGMIPPVELHFGDGNGLVLWLSQLQWTYLIPDSYHAMKVSFGMIGLVGVYVFYRAASLAMSRRDERMLLVLGIVPSTLQWSSIVGKDPVTSLGIALYCLGVMILYVRPRVSGLLAIVVGVGIASTIRPWMAAILFAPLAIFVFGSLRGILSKVLFGGAAIGAFVASLFLFSSALKVESIDDVVARSQDISQSFSYGGSANTSDIATENSPQKMLAFAPLGIATALFRPLPGEVLNLFGFLASLENALLVVLFILMVRRFRRSDYAHPVVRWALLLVLVWSFVYGFVCYNNMGTSVRYRFQIFPVFFCLLIYLSRSRSSTFSAAVVRHS